MIRLPRFRYAVPLATLALALGVLLGPSNAHAAASCTTINAGIPNIAGHVGDYYFKSTMHVDNCSAKTYLVATLLVEFGGVYSETGCDGQPVPSCAVIYPTTGGDCDGGIHFCAYTDITRLPTFHPNGNMCGRNFRSRLQVYSANGVFIGQDTSPTERC